MIHTHKSWRTVPTCDNSLGLLTLTAPEDEDSVELVLLQHNSSIQRRYYSVVQLTSRRSRVRFPVGSLGIFHLLNHFGRAMALGRLSCYEYQGHLLRRNGSR